MPAVRFFVDTNVLLYAHDRSGAEKGRFAAAWVNALVDRQIACINLQVLNELTYVLLRKKWFDSAATVFKVADDFAVLGASAVTLAETNRARILHQKVQYSWWDCLLLASALELGCKFFLSEDLQDGQAIEGLTIIDPFAHSPDLIPILR